MAPIRRTAVACCVLSAAVLHAQVDYAQVSTGLNTPAWDGGRTTLRLADLNGDGHLDLVTVGDHGSPYINTNMHGVTVWFGDGANHWSVFQYGNFGYGGVAVGDVNNDGLADVGYGIHHNSSGVDLGNQLLEVALGDGTGMFWSAWDDGLAQEGQDWGMFGTEFADFDGDGWLDVGSISFGADDGVHVYRNNHDGTWTRTFGFIGGNSTMDVGSGDVNGDGAPDFITAHQNGTVWINDWAGAFVHGDANLPAAGSLGRKGPSVGDVDGDGLDDVSFVTTSGGAAVWGAVAGGTWRDLSGALPASGSIEETHLADMDGDGRLDLVTFGAAQGRVWLGDGAGGWTLGASFSTPSAGEYAGLTVGDADHNGRPDIAIVSREGNWPNDRNKLHLFSETSTPVQPAIRITGPTAHHTLRAGSVVFIDWLAAVPGADSAMVSLELSVTGPSGPWSPIEGAAPNSGRFQVTLAGVGPTAQAYLRATLSTGAHGSAQHVMGPLAIVGTCLADFNGDGLVNTLDVLAFLNAWASGDARADFNGDGAINTLDVLAFLNAWRTGCP